MEKQIYEDDLSKFIIDDGILYGKFKIEFLDLETSKKITNSRVQLQKGKEYPIISDIRDLKKVAKPARDFMASEEGCQGVKAAAVLINSPLGSMIGNFFIFISRPLRPTKIFADELEAKAWLSNFKELLS